MSSLGLSFNSEEIILKAIIKMIFKLSNENRYLLFTILVSYQ